MKIFNRMGDFFALDVGTNAIRVVQLTSSGNAYTLAHYGYAVVDSKLTSSNSAEGKRKLGEVIMTAIGQSGVRTKNVVIGLPSSKTFTTVIDVPDASHQEMQAMMKYQADKYIPMSVDEAKVDWALLGSSLKKQGEQEVLLTSTAKKYTEEQLEFIESLGLNVVAAEPEPIAMVRALAPENSQTCLLLLDMGEASTDIVVVYGNTPRLVRTIPIGVASLVKAAASNLNVQEDQARQFILKFGLAQDKLDGQVVQAVEMTLDNFVNEIVKSVKFFQNQYSTLTIESIMASGFASSIPQLDNYLAQKTNIQVRLADPWSGIVMNQDASSQLTTVASEFATAIGLAKRKDA